MVNRSFLLFDLDGTLTDPALGITNSVMYALQKLGAPVEERSFYYRFIGPPLLDSFARATVAFRPKNHARRCGCTGILADKGMKTRSTTVFLRCLRICSVQDIS